MEINRPPEKIKETSMDQIIATIEAARDRQIDELMKEPILMSFLEHYYNTVTISDVKTAFLTKDLIELKNSPLDLSHYSSLIKKMKESNSMNVDINHRLFHSELKILFQKYGF